MIKIAITVIAYNRVRTLQRMLSSLDSAYYDGDEVSLFISIDKSNTDAVERFADEYHWPYGNKMVVKHTQNLGLRKHVLEQGKLLEDFDAVVVFEDDLVVAPDFWSYVRQTVAAYNEDENIAGISLYSYAVNYHSFHPFIPYHKGSDVYFMNCAMSWGQVWMRKQWKAFETWYAEHQDFPDMPHLPESICAWSDKSWLKYHTRYCIEENKYFVFPYVSYTTNYSEIGAHISEANNIFQVPLQNGRIGELQLPKSEDEMVRYNGFFENKKLYEVLGLKEEECCLDLCATDNNRTHKRYWLSTRKLPFKVLKTFDYSCRPIEQNVFVNVEGSGLYLYDTMIKDKCPKTSGNPVFLSSYLMQNLYSTIREYGYVNLAIDFWKLMKRKIKYLLKK